MKFYFIFVLLIIFALNANSSSVSEIEISSDISSEECLEVLENGNMINIIDCKEYLKLRPRERFVFAGP